MDVTSPSASSIGTEHDKTMLGLGVLITALVLGVLGDGLLRERPWGLNVALWTMALILAVAAIVRWRRIPLAGDGRWLVIPGLFFAAAIAWRDSRTLFSLNLLCLLAVAALAATSTRFGRLRTATLVDYGLLMLPAMFSAVAGPLQLITSDIRWQEIQLGGRSQ